MIPKCTGKNIQEVHIISRVSSLGIISSLKQKL